MGHLKIVVDHEKIDYSGPCNVNDLLKMIENFIFYMGYDKKQEKDFEINTHNGKFIEWQYSPWKKITDYVRYIIKIRILGYDIVKTDMMLESKKTKVENCRLIIVIDGFIEYDYEDKWGGLPMLQLLRTIYDYFVFKVYTERFEHRLVNDINHLTDNIEKFLNLYRHYTIISRPA